jgi:ABC-type dipeptide/oligopeptide/nickel transport system permease subunit
MNNSSTQLSGIAVEQVSLWRMTWRNFRRHRLAMFSLVLLIILALMAIFADQLAPYDPNDINPQDPSRGTGDTRTAEPAAHLRHG